VAFILNHIVTIFGLIYLLFGNLDNNI
jgi:hypothetical protein